MVKIKAGKVSIKDAGVQEFCLTEEEAQEIVDSFGMIYDDVIHGDKIFHPISLLKHTFRKLDKQTQFKILNFSHLWALLNEDAIKIEDSDLNQIFKTKGEE